MQEVDLAGDEGFDGEVEGNEVDGGGKVVEEWKRGPRRRCGEGVGEGVTEGVEGVAGGIEGAGGEVDPLQDIAAGAVALVGGVLALQGAYMKWWSGDEPYLGIKGTQKMTGKGTMYLQFRKSSIDHINKLYKQY